MFCRNYIILSGSMKRYYHKIGVIGVPFNKGQTKNGVDKAPRVLRDSGVLNEIVALNPKNDVKDYGDISYKITDEHNINSGVTNMIHWTHVSECNRLLSLQVNNIIKDNRVCLTFGGDHSIGFGTIHGHATALKNVDVAVLWVDAHADINTNTSSPTGNLHGMPMALVAKELTQEWTNIPLLDWRTSSISLKRLAYIGLRSVDSFERHIIDKYNITAFDMKDVQIYGIQNVIKMALHRIDPDQTCSLHVSFDIDSLDVLEAPSTGTPVRGGLTLREGVEIMETVAETNRLQAMDLVEVNPLLGTIKDVQMTVEAAKNIILAAFGNKRKGVKLIK